MRLKRFEIAILCVTVLFFAFTGGYFLGRNTVHASITTSTDVQLETNSAPPDTSATQPEIASTIASAAGPATAPTDTAQTDTAPTDAEATEEAEKVNLNTATSEQLQQLNGIGPKLAERIIAYRNENGAFQTKEQIMEVSGIGEGIFAKVKDDITVE